MLVQAYQGLTEICRVQHHGRLPHLLFNLLAFIHISQPQAFKSALFLEFRFATAATALNNSRALARVAAHNGPLLAQDTSSPPLSELRTPISRWELSFSSIWAAR